MPMLSIEKIIRNTVKVDLDGLDMKKMTNSLYQTVLYEDLAKYKSITKLVGKNNGVIILYETSSEYQGHWTCLWITVDKKNIMFFDSYAFKPDEEISFAHYTRNVVRRFYLTDLLRKDGRNVLHNPYKLQLWKHNVNTCGRWVGVRLRWKHLTHAEFNAIFTKSSHEEPDFWITILSFMCINDDLNDQDIFKKII